MRVDLTDAVEDLYRVFAAYPRRAEMESCPCCVGAAEKHTLARVALRELNAPELSRYAFKAMTTWGAVDDYKHFLPRILELIALGDNDAFAGLQLELVASKMHYGALTEWPSVERDALRTYIDALWREFLGHDPEMFSDSASEILRGCAHAVGNAQRFLDVWQRNDSFAVRLHLARTIAEHIRPVSDPTDDDGPWREPAAYKTFIAWLREPQRRRELQQAFETNIDDPRSTQIAEALDLLEWCKP